jgi:hypothetical protein
MKVTGFFLFVIGLLLIVLPSFKFFSTETLIDLGEVEITREKLRTFRWSPVIGAVAIGAGGILVWQGFRKKKSFRHPH